MVQWYIGTANCVWTVIGEVGLFLFRFYDINLSLAPAGPALSSLDLNPIGGMFVSTAATGPARGIVLNVDCGQDYDNKQNKTAKKNTSVSLRTALYVFNIIFNIIL